MLAYQGSTTDSNDRGWFIIDNADLPEWIGDISSGNVHFSFMGWFYRKADTDGNHGRTILTFSDTTTTPPKISIRHTDTSFQTRTYPDGSSTFLQEAGENFVGVADEWTLVGMNVDFSGASAAIKVFSISETGDREQETDTVLEAAPSGFGTSLENMFIGYPHNNQGQKAWSGALEGYTFWKDVDITMAEMREVYNARNRFPFTMGATGALPGPDHDGIYAVPMVPADNSNVRGSGTNIDTGMIMGSTIGSAQDILVFWQETGVADTGEVTISESNTVVGTDLPIRYFNPFKETI